EVSGGTARHPDAQRGAAGERQALAVELRAGGRERDVVHALEHVQRGVAGFPLDFPHEPRLPRQRVHPPGARHRMAAERHPDGGPQPSLVETSVRPDLDLHGPGLRGYVEMVDELVDDVERDPPHVPAEPIRMASGPPPARARLARDRDSYAHPVFLRAGWPV